MSTFQNKDVQDITMHNTGQWTLHHKCVLLKVVLQDCDKQHTVGNSSLVIDIDTFRTINCKRFKGVKMLEIL